MSSLNIRTNAESLNNTTPEKLLERIVLASMLWEDQFYIDGVSSSSLVRDTVSRCNPLAVSLLAIKARSEYKLRHIPLLLVCELARDGKLHSDVLDAVIQRPDEMAELLAIYWKDGKVPISNQIKKGLAKAFAKFNEYQLAKWDKNSAAISLRDVMFLVHPTPASVDQENLFKRVAAKELKTPDTWEVALSSGENKALVFVRLMLEKKLGAMAFIRNLRNMITSGVNEAIIRGYARTVNVDNVLPFRFIAAARVVPALEDMLEEMMFRACATLDKISGHTAIVVDVSGSMFGPKVSEKSDIDRFDAAAALAVLLRETCEDVSVFSFSNSAIRVPPRHGFALVESLKTSQVHGGTNLKMSMKQIDNISTYDRVIVVTDEQSTTKPLPPKGKGYILNVGAYKNGINSGDWTTITGFSESVVKYIQALEAE